MATIEYFKRPRFNRQPDDEYLKIVRPLWYVEHVRRATPTLSLDLNQEYSKDEYWNVDLTQQDAGMPVFHRHWCFNLIDTFVPSVTRLNLEKCGLGDTGLLEFALVLKANTALRHLNLKDNDLSSQKTIEFLNALEEFNFSLVTLEFHEGNKSAMAKNKNQHDAVAVQTVASEIYAGESEKTQFEKLIKTRAERITTFNLQVCNVIDGKSDTMDLLFHESKREEDKKASDANKRPARANFVTPYASRATELRGDRFGLALSMAPKLKKLLIENMFPFKASGGNAKWFDELPEEERMARLTHDTKLPDELWTLPNLEEMCFYNCIDPNNKDNTFFTTIPFDVTRLRKLRKLVISRCGLVAIEGAVDAGPVAPKFMGENLERSVLHKMTQLQDLGLPGNRLKRIPETIGYCVSLTRLSLRQNRLEHLPDAILMLTNLKELLAESNQIWKVPISLPKYLTRLTDFKILHQGDDTDKTTLIPGDEKELKALHAKELNASKERTPCPDVINYMRSFLQKNKTIRLNRYKLVVVGDGAVGKTTTIRSLQQQAAAARKKKKKDNILDNVATDGIAIQMLRLPAGAKRTPGWIGGNECLHFSSWDFAGQDVYTYSHTFFMTEKSLYLIGFDCSLGDSSAGIERVDYWLQVVRTRFPNAHCIVFGTQIDKVPKDDLKNLQKAITGRYKISKTKDKTTGGKKDLFKVSNVEFISNATGKGLDELISDIKKFPTLLEKNRKNKKSNDEEIPIKWLILEERGKAKGATRLVPVMQWSEWMTMAQAELEMDEAQLKEATSYWHETGSISWFNEDGLRDIVVLRPDFLTDVFASVITATMGTSSGILKHDALIQIWKGIPMYLYPHLLTILEKFELLHKLEGGVLEGDAGNLFASGATTSLMTAADVMAGLTSNSPNGGILQPAQGGIVSQGGVTIDFGNGPEMAAPIKTKSMFTGRSIIPALLPEQEPPAAEITKAWPDLPKGAQELARLYTFDFVPNGFFSRLLVRLLHTKWKASLMWRWGIVLSKSMAKLFLRYDGATRTMSLRVRGPANVSKVGPLIDSISTLISDWLNQAEITVRIPYTYPDGAQVDFLWADVEKAAHAGQMTVPAPNRPNLNPVRIDQLAPDLALLTTSAKIWKEAELHPGKELGRGGFAIVLKGQLPTGEPVALKKLIYDKSKEETGETTFSDVFTEFRREVWLMSGLQHPNLVRLLGVCTSPHLMMVLEFMEGGTLHDYLHGDEDKPKATLTLEDKYWLALQVAKGMQFMHGMNPPIIHRDLKSPNILMTSRGPKGEQLRIPVPKIADFGLSRGLSWTSSMDDKAVDNPVWLAPEIIMRKPYNEKADVYSYGVILYEIALQLRFMEEIQFDYQKEDAVRNGKRPELPTDLDPVLTSLIQFCWHQDPNRRPAFDQVVECLEKKTIITSARPSILNYGTGFEEFDQIPEEPTPESSPSPSQRPTGTPALRSAVSSMSVVVSSSSSPILRSSQSTAKMSSSSSPIIRAQSTITKPTTPVAQHTSQSTEVYTPLPSVAPSRPPTSSIPAFSNTTPTLATNGTTHDGEEAPPPPPEEVVAAPVVTTTWAQARPRNAPPSAP